MADHNKPSLASLYEDFVEELNAKCQDLAMGLDPISTTATNLPVSALRWSSAASKWQKYNGTTWGDMASTYAINVMTANALAVARSLGVSGDITGSASFDGSSNATISATLATVNSNVGTFGSTASAVTIVVNGKGLITGVSTSAFTSGSAVLRGNGSGGFVNATAAEIVAAIGSTAVANAASSASCSGNAVTSSSCSGNAASSTYATTIPYSSTDGTLVASDTGKCVNLGAGITIPSNVFSQGQAVTLYNATAGSVSILQGASLTLRQVGTANTGNRTLAQRGLVTVWFISATEAVISGGGLT
jgi:hypothetical protein